MYIIAKRPIYLKDVKTIAPNPIPFLPINKNFLRKQIITQLAKNFEERSL